jgi:hypothetical protein
VDALSREKYDAMVTFAIKGYMDQEQRTCVEERLELYLPDFDGNGVSNVISTLCSCRWTNQLGAGFMPWIPS